MNMTSVSASIPDSPYIAVVPDTIVDFETLTPGKNFTVSIKTDYSAASDVWGWQFTLSYNPKVLRGGPYNFTDTWSGDGTTTSFYTTKTPIVPDSEEVYVNGILMTRFNESDPGTPWDYMIIPEWAAPLHSCMIMFQTAPGLGAEIKVEYLWMGITQGDLIHPDKSDDARFEPGEFDNVEGKLSLTAAYFKSDFPLTTTSGPGTLANVTFTVNGTGASDITLGMSQPGQTQLKAPTYNIIDAVMNPNQIGHGYFQNGEIINEPPVAVISAPSIADAGELVTFDGSGSSDAVAHGQNGVIVSYLWDFGDLSTPGTDEIVTHDYTSTGIYTVNLTVTDDDGATDTATHDITIIPPNEPPVAVILGPSSAEVGDLVTFDGSASDDPDGTIVSYLWDFGDGNTSTTMESNNTYTLPGVYSVKLTVTDDGIHAKTGNAYHTILITEPTPWNADLVKWMAKAERHRWVESKDPGGKVTLYALAENLGIEPVNVTITFAILDGRYGEPAGDSIVVDDTLAVNETKQITVEIDPYDYGYDGTGKVVLFPAVTLSHDSDGDGIVDKVASTKITRCAIVP